MTNFLFTSGSHYGPQHHPDDNQDNFALRISEDYIIVCVADGAGSLENSAKGADIAVNSAADYADDAYEFTENLEKLVLDSLQTARDRILSIEDYKTMGCTVALGIFSKEKWSVGIIGDAFAVVHHLDGFHELVTTKRSSEFANETTFITSRNYSPIVVSGNEEIVGLSVCSDGMIPHAVVSASEMAFSDFWNSILNRLTKNKNFPANDFLEYLFSNDKLEDDTTFITAINSDS